MTKKTKKLFVKTYGCQMNAYDSGRMADLLHAEGFETTAVPAEADLIILNTCHIREKAAEKVYSELGRLAEAKAARAKERPLTLAVAGCVAQAEGEEIAARAPYVDIVIGPQAYHRLPDLVRRAPQAETTQVLAEFPVESKFDFLPEEASPRGTTAFLTVQEGCDKFCTFCVVPYTRGAEASRPVAAVLAEARRLVADGVREITLLGQNVNAYRGAQRGGAASLAALMAALSDIPDLLRIRYTTSHPRDVTDDLIAEHGRNPKLMPYLHLPVQAGADRVLSAMNRRYTADDYRRVVERLRRARPDLALSSDFIVGFPGETDAEFAATLALAREIGFASAFAFKYSPRPGTPAADLADQVPEDVKEARLAALLALLVEQQTAFNRSCIGRTLDVLIVDRGRHPGQVAGRSPYLQAVHADAPATLIGQVVPVRIMSASTNSLTGSLAGAATQGAHAA